TTVTQSFSLAASAPFANYVFGSSFAGLKSVTWNSGSSDVFATNIAANSPNSGTTPAGAGGRFLYQSNTGVTLPTVTAATASPITTVWGRSNTYFEGTSEPTTPYIPDLAGGADIFGLVPGGVNSFSTDTVVQSAITNAKLKHPDALVAVVREHQPEGFADFKA